MRQRQPPRHRTFARAMRRDATPAEAKLCQALRAGQLEGFKFKRQVPLDGYILDFVCFETRLIIELDGSQHAENHRDQFRDRHFEVLGFRTIRFWNDEVLKHCDEACRMVLTELRNTGEG